MKWLCAWMVAFASFTAFAQEEGRQYFLLDTPLSILPGNSETALYRHRMEFMNRLTHVQVLIQTGCTAKIRTLEIEYREGEPRKFYSEFDNKGVMKLEQTGFLGFGVQFYNPELYSVNCHVRLIGFEGKPENTGNNGSYGLEDFILAGSIGYEGGFQRSLLVPVSPQNPVTHVWVRRPEFCKELQILEVRYGSSEGFKKAKLVDAEKLIYELVSPDGILMQDVLISANGPRDLACDIPVFIRSLGEEPTWP